MDKKSDRVLTTRSLVLAALFVGINIILSRFGAIMLFNNAIRLSFGDVPVVLAGFILGPIPGFLTGVVSDLLGFLINSYGGAYHPGFTLSAGLIGAVPGLIMTFRKKAELLEIIIANIINYLFMSGVLNSLWLSQLIGTGFWVLLPARLASNFVVVIVNILITQAVLKRLYKAGYMK